MVIGRYCWPFAFAPPYRGKLLEIVTLRRIPVGTVLMELLVALLAQA